MNSRGSRVGHKILKIKKRKEKRKKIILKTKEAGVAYLLNTYLGISF
jgi:hypothetical protein